ncbi:MAG: hypothetical protein UHM85_05705 [Acutalibacteraceae bacterium]|nr:hypothetical protein [Acutalibacteraceae bacterium]
MNKTLKKIIAIVLTAIMLMSVAVVASAESYVDPDSGIIVEDVETTAPEAEEDNSVHHGGEYDNLFEIIAQFWVEVFNFFKYIFYDVFLGKPA